MSGKLAETINGSGLDSGMHRNPDEAWQQLTLSVVKSKFLNSGFRRSDGGQLMQVQAR